jgi:serine/threonine-protein kinase
LLAKLEHTGFYESFLARPVEAPQTLKLIRRLHSHLERQPGYVEMFCEQARIASRIVHPNVVRVLDQGAFEGRHYVTYEWLHGQPLGRAVKRLCGEGRGMPLPLALHIADRILDALEYAHGLAPDPDDGAIVHGEVSPGNVLLGYDGRVVLLGFGAIRPNDPRLRPELTAVHGGYGYASPEQGKGTDVDRRSDVWSAGVLLWEMLAGRHLFVDPSEMAVLRQLLHGEIAKLEDVAPDVPKSLARVVSAALCRDRDLRPPSAHAFMDRLRAASDERAGTEELAARMKALFVAEEGKDRMLLEELMGLSVERLIDFPSEPPPPPALTDAPIAPHRSRNVMIAVAVAAALGLAGVLAQSGF